MAILKFRHRNNIHTIRLFKLMHLITSSRYSSRVKSAKQFHFSGTYFGCVLKRLRDSQNGLVLHQLARKKLLRCVRQRPGERGLAARSPYVGSVLDGSGRLDGGKQKLPEYRDGPNSGVCGKMGSTGSGCPFCRLLN